MSIRSGVYVFGDTVRISGSFVDDKGLPMNATDITLYIRDPDKTLSNQALIPVNGGVAFDIPVDKVGEWRLRLECKGPVQTATELRFQVVESAVLE